MRASPDCPGLLRPWADRRQHGSWYPCLAAGAGTVDRLENTQGCFNVRLLHDGQDAVPEFNQNLLDPLSEPFTLVGQPNGLGPPVFRIASAFHQSRRTELIEQADERGAFDADTRCQLDLANAAAHAADPHERSGPSLRNPMSVQRLLRQPAPLPASLHKGGR